MSGTSIKRAAVFSFVFLLAAGAFAHEANIFHLSNGSGPVIDGEIDGAWNAFGWVGIKKTVQGGVAGASDFSAFYKAAYSDGAIYVAVKVIDDVISAVSGPQFYFDNDSISLFFDFGNEGGSGLDGDDVQLSAVYGYTGLYSREGLPTAGIAKAWKRTADGYVLEMAIPYGAVGQSALTAGRRIGFDVLLNDFDELGYRECVLSWSGDESDYSGCAGLGEWSACGGTSRVVMEAEAGVYGQMRSASLRGVSFLETLSADAGKAVFALGELEPGVYYAWVKAKGDDAQSGEFAIDFDNEYDRARASAVKFAPTGEFGWISGDSAKLFVESPGAHTLTVFSTRKFVQIDRIVLTNDPTFIPVAISRPRISSVGVNGGQIVITWAAVNGSAEELAVERKRPADAGFSEIARVEASATVYTDASISAEDGIEYRLKSVGSLDASAYSQAVRLHYRLPEPPRNLTLGRENNRDKLSWENPGGTISGYSIELRLDNSEYVEIQRLGGGSTEYEHGESHVLEHYRLSYRMRAFNGYGYSAYAYAQSEGDLIRDIKYSNESSDVYVTHDFDPSRPPDRREIPGKYKRRDFQIHEGAVYQDRPKGTQENLFLVVPQYLKGTEYLRALRADGACEDAAYLKFTAAANIMMYLAVVSGANVDTDIWELVENGVSINPILYPQGMDIYKRTVFKDTVVELGANRGLTPAGNQYMLFLEEDPSANICINFGPAQTGAIEGYRLDSGAIFGARADGLSYGWRTDASSHAVDRDLHENDLVDTYIEVPDGNAWEIALPDGTYQVSLTLGDDWLTGAEQIRINGSLYAFNEDRQHVREIPKHLSIQTDVVISAQCGNKLILDRNVLPAKLNYIRIIRTANHLHGYTAVADTYIESSDVHEVNGGQAYIHVSEHNKHRNFEDIGMFGFEIPDYQDPIHAYLTLYVRELQRENPDGVRIQIYAVDGYTFNENSQNWSNCDLVSIRQNRIYLSDRAEYLGEILANEENSTYRLDITSYLARRSSANIAFLAVSREDSKASAVLYAREKGVNQPRVEIISGRQTVELEGYLYSPEAGRYALQATDYLEYGLTGPYIDLAAYVNANVAVRGYVDPEYEAQSGQKTRIIVEEIQVIPPPGSPMITVSPWNNTGYPVWAWSAPVGATVYRYRLDGGVWQETSALSYMPASPLGEGSHTLELACRNRISDWSDTVSATVTVDRTPPRITEMNYVNPTNNRRPPFNWKASDNYSVPEEILFQYRMDNGEWIFTISESYVPAEALEEGTRVFQIKARDLAGNWAETAFYPIHMDYTPPAEASGLAVYYNESGARLIWTDSVSDDVDYYLVTRAPASVKTERVERGAQELLDITASLANDEVYTYTVRAVDKATNINTGAAIADGATGDITPTDLEVKIVNGGTVKAFFAPGVVDEAVTVVIKRADAPVASKPGVRQIGPVYHFEPEGAEFNAPIMLYFSYTDGQLADLADEGALCVAYYDPVKLNWVKIPSAVDTAANEIIAFTNHFSEYSLRVDTSDAYEGEGINPFGEYYTNLNEAVSESGGDLNVAFNLAKISGVRGNDLSLNLLYSSSDAMAGAESAISRTKERIYNEMNRFYNHMGGSQYEILTKPSDAALPTKDFSLGSGWSLDIPHILNATAYLPGGSGYSLNLGQFVHSGIHYSSERVGNNVVLTMSNGYVYTFDGTRYFANNTAEGQAGAWVDEYYLKLKQFNQSNSISQEELGKAFKKAFCSWDHIVNDTWATEMKNTVARLSSVTDPFGNTISYAYTEASDHTVTAVTLSSGADSISYDFTSGTVSGNGEEKAKLLIDNSALRRIKQKKSSDSYLDTVFEYTTHTLKYDITYYSEGNDWKEEKKEKTQPVILVSKITYPSSARTDYSGELKTEEQQNRYRYNSQKVSNRDGVLEKEVGFNYEGGFRQISRSATLIKNRDSSTAQETYKYYNLSGNMYREYSAARDTAYEYYYEAGIGDRAVITFKTTGMTMEDVKYPASSNVFTTPGSGISISEFYLEAEGMTPQQALMINLDGANDLYLGAANDGALLVFHGTHSKASDAIFTIKKDKVKSAESGYIFKDPVNKLLEYMGNDIFLVLKGSNAFEIVYTKLDQNARVKRGRVKVKAVTDGDLTYSENYDYDGWGNAIYIKNADGHRIFKTYHPDYHEQQTENMESRNTGAVYADRNAVEAAGNFNKTTWEFTPGRRAPDSTTLYEGTATRKTSYTYNSNGNVTIITDPSGGETVFGYNPKGLLESRTVKGVEPYSQDVTTGYMYDSQNRMATETIGSRTTAYEYDLLGRVTGITNPDGSKKIQYYDDAASATIVANAEAGHTEYMDEILSEGLNEKTRSNLVNKVKYLYNGLTNLTGINKYMHGLNQPYYQVSLSYNALGKMTGSADMGGRTTARAYDLRGRLRKLTREDAGDVNIYYYDSLLITEYRDEENFVTRLQNDLAGRLKQIWIQKTAGGPDYYGTQYEYDGVGNKVKITNGLIFDYSGGIVSGGQGGDPEIFESAYNGFSDLVRQTAPDRAVINPMTGIELGVRDIQTEFQITFQNEMKISQALSPNDVLLGRANGAKSYSDTQGKVLKTQTPLTYETANLYDIYGELVQATDAENHNKYSAYTDRGLVKYERDGDNNYIGYSYDILGNVTRKTYGTYDPLQADPYDPPKYWEDFAYDSLSRLIRQGFPDGTSVSYDLYDMWGNVLAQKDRGGRSTTFTYDNRNRVLSVTAPSGVTTSYGYNKRGEKILETNVRAGTHADYAYNGLGQMVSYDNPAGRRLTFEYDRVGRKIKRTEGTTAGAEKNVTTYAYLPGTELASSVTVSHGANNQTLQTLGYDANGNLCVDNRNGVIRSYLYDADNRVFQETDSADQGLHILYTYYDNGLLFEKTERSGKKTTSTYSQANRVLSVLDSLGGKSETTSYGYDFMGRVLSVSRDGSDPFTKNYTYGESTGYLTQEGFSAESQSFSTGYSYAPGGELSGILYPGSTKKISYGYDSYGRLSTVQGVTPSGGLWYNTPELTLDLLESVSLNNGMRIDYGYDQAYRLTGISYGDAALPTPAWKLINSIDEYGNVTGQTMSGDFIQGRFGQAERKINYSYDFRNRLTDYASLSVDPYALSVPNDEMEATSVTRDFDVAANDRDKQYFLDLNSEHPKTEESKPGMDYDVDNSLILYYPEIKSSKNAQTKKELFALDSEGRNFILELGEVKSNIQSVRLYPVLYSKQGETVSKVQEYEGLFARFSEYNLVVKIVQSGEYTLVPSHTVALEGGLTGTTWSMYKDMTKGVLEIRFSSGIQTDEIKVNVLIDGRNPQLVSDTPENAGLLMNPTARESEYYFDAVGAFINSVEFMAEVEYVLNATQSVSFEYDVNGNRTSKTTNYGGVEERRTNYSYEPGTNRLQNDGEYSYEYDEDGNLVRRYNSYVEYVYQWNLQNRLEKVYLKQFRRGWNSEWEASLTEAQLNEFLLIFQAKYDESGQRYWKWARRMDGSEVETGYAYTSMGLLYERSDEGGAIKERSYIYASGKKLAQVEGSLDVAEADGNGVVIGFAAAAIKYMVCDQLGSTRLMVDAAGEVAWYGEYAPFGESTYEASITEGVSTNQTFTSYTRDVEIGLQYAMNRYYLPELGRFISEDPGRDGINWYVYCRNNPLAFVDPTGLRTEDGEEDVTVNTTIPEEPPDLPDPSDSPEDFWKKVPSDCNNFELKHWEFVFWNQERIDEVYNRILAGEHPLLSNFSTFLIKNFNTPTRNIARAEFPTHVINLATVLASAAVTSNYERSSVLSTVLPSGVVSPPTIDEKDADVLRGYALFKTKPTEGAGKGAGAGPVVFKIPPGATAKEIAQMKEYARLSNQALEAGALSPTGRVSTTGALRADASSAAAAERARAASAGIPYSGQAGHVPDTTWTGAAQPYTWLDLSPKVNSSLGAQASWYPLGYRPTGFTVE